VETLSAINPSVKDQEYVLPTTCDLYPSLVGSEVFSELDLSDAYTKESQEYLAIATHNTFFPI